MKALHYTLIAAVALALGVFVPQLTSAEEIKKPEKSNYRPGAAAAQEEEEEEEAAGEEDDDSPFATEKQELDKKEEPEFLERSLIEMKISNHYSKIKYCYQKVINNNKFKNLNGKVFISFFIEQNGKVKKVDILPTSTLKNDEVYTCIKEKVRAIEFPARNTKSVPLQVNYRFNFQAK